MKTIDDITAKLIASEDAIIDWMIAEGWSQSKIEAEFEKLAKERRKQIAHRFQLLDKK